MRRARTRAALTLPALLLAWAPAFGGAVPLGSEFQANSYTSSSHQQPRIALNDAGLFIIVWPSYLQDGDHFGIFGRRMAMPDIPLGAEFQVNTYTTNEQFYPSVGIDASGAFTVVWESSYQISGLSVKDDVFGQRFDSTGTPAGGEFMVNTYSFDLQYRQEISVMDDGSFVVVWNSFAGQDGHRNGVLLRRYDSSGSPLGGEIQVNTWTTEDQRLPAVAGDDQGNFVVVWEGDDEDGDLRGIFGQRYDSAGSPAGGEFQVNTYTTGDQWGPVIAASAAGRFVVAWGDTARDGQYGGIFGRVFNEAGNPVGSDFQVNTITTGSQGAPDVALDEVGNFIAVWHSDHSKIGSRRDIYARRFLPDGTPMEPEFRINASTAGNNTFPSVAMEPAGTFVVTWSDDVMGPGLEQIRGRTLGWTAPFLTSPVNGGTVDCSDPVNIQPTVAWIGDTYDRFKVFMGSDPAFVKGTRVTSGKRWLKTESWMPSRKKWRKACRKALEADPNLPVLYFNVVGKDRDLPKKDPARIQESLVVGADVQP